MEFFLGFRNQGRRAGYRAGCIGIMENPRNEGYMGSYLDIGKSNGTTFFGFRTLGTKECFLNSIKKNSINPKPTNLDPKPLNPKPSTRNRVATFEASKLL